MHYYQFNIADYRKDTQHLTPIEHYIYRSLLDWMYLDETTIPKKIPFILRRLGLPNDRSTDVEQVLNDFFTDAGDCYTQARAMREIGEYRRRIESAVVAGKASAKAKKANKNKGIQRPFNDRSTTVQPTNNQEPITNNQLKDMGDKSPRQQFNPPTLDDVTAYVTTREVRIDPQRFIDHYTANGWRVGRNPMKDWQACVRTWEKRERENTKPTVNGYPDARRLSGAERTRLARERAFERERLAANASGMGCVEPD